MHIPPEPVWVSYYKDGTCQLQLQPTLFFMYDEIHVCLDFGTVFFFVNEWTNFTQNFILHWLTIGSNEHSILCTLSPRICIPNKFRPTIHKKIKVIRLFYSLLFIIANELYLTNYDRKHVYVF